MSDSTVARRYAQALSEMADERGVLEQIDEDIDMVRASLEGAPELRRFFASPVIGREKKEAVVTELLGERTHALTLQFVKLLIRKKRERLLGEIAAAYRSLRDEQLGIVEVQARTAEPLSEEERAELEKALAERTGKQVRLETSVDESLMGGVVVRIGDTVIDGSVQHQLRALRDRLEKGAHTNGAAAA